jgi:hypothetical protein
MKPQKKTASLPPIRIRREPPTVEEAVSAAQGLSGDLQQQVQIAAGLMGVPEDEVAPMVSALRSAPRTPERRPGSHTGSPRVVILKRRSVR